VESVNARPERCVGTDRRSSHGVRAPPNLTHANGGHDGPAASDRITLERRTRRLRQRVKDLGAEIRLLRWEQRDGWLAVAPIRRTPLDGRGLRRETGTVASTYPFSAGTLQLEGGVPFGVAASAPVTFTTAHPRNKNHHMC